MEDNAYSDLRALTSPEIHNDDKIKKRKLLQNFKDSYDELVATIEFFELDSTDFSEMISERENARLSAILMAKDRI